MDHDGIEILCEYEPFWYDVRVWIAHTKSGIRSIAQPIEFKEITKENEGLIPEPAFRLRVSEAQHLMDDLWRIGLRPTEGTGSAGALAATEKHLEDMRKIAFNVLEIK